MGKARKKNIKRAKKDMMKNISSANKEFGVTSEEAMDNFMKIFQRLSSNK